MPVINEKPNPELRIIRRRTIDLDPELASWVQPQRPASSLADLAVATGPELMRFARPWKWRAPALAVIGLMLFLLSSLR